jgi:RNA polymerase sigma-70 factor (ECF subfamily)
MQPDEVRSSEEALVAAATGGDQAAFSELVRRHQDEVFTLALRLTADRELAADVAQEALVRAWRALPGFRGEARFATWLYRITVNTARTHTTRATRRRTHPLSEAVEPADGGVSPERAGESAAVRGKIEAALRDLPASIRSVVVMKDVYGWTHPEIAEELGITVTAAKVRLHRGRRRLRDVLGTARP